MSNMCHSSSFTLFSQNIQESKVPMPVQALLAAVGVGAKSQLPAAATINWLLKDGLGRLGRLSIAASFGQSFDSDLKVTVCR